MTNAELLKEIKRLDKLLTVAAKRAAAQHVLIDKLTAAHLQVQAIIKMLKRQHMRKSEVVKAEA